MKRIHLAAVDAIQSDDTLILLAEKEAVDRLHSLLVPSEMAFLQQAAARDIQSFFFPRGEGALLVRLFGKDADSDAAREASRLAGNELLRELRHYKIESVAIRDLCARPRLYEVAEGLALGSYQFLKFFSQPEKKEKPLRAIRLEGADPLRVAELEAIIEAVFLARDLVNEPQSHLDSVRLATLVEEMAVTNNIQVEILGKEKIQCLQMGGLLAVNRASSIPPRFCILEWNPEGAVNEHPWVLVGKGVVYDTGGLSLKPTEGMDYMKCDMAGAATVVGAMVAAAKNKLPARIIGLLPVTDNLIGERAIAPGDVVRMFSGHTVEVLNTDAEGRLILADALHFAKKFNPEFVFDIATLTGAAVRALGSQAICYMGNASRTVKETLESSGWQTYERLVELPLWKEYGDDLKSNIADLRNVGSGNAGMITAGKFLEHFADFPWLHLDIAGPAYLRQANGYRTKEGTGVGVRLLYRFFKQLVEKPDQPDTTTAR